MTAKDYRDAVDAVSFRPDFVPHVLSLLEAHRKEPVPMKKPALKTVLAAAALIAALAVTASAVVYLLSPGQVAREVGMDALAQVFEGEDAVRANQTETVGDYQVTLLGMAPGVALSQLDDGVNAQKTYAVLAYTRTDGTPIAESGSDLTVTPLVEGYAPWQVNAWSLNSFLASFVQDGTLYCLLECDTVEPFADHTVYLAVYPGTHSVPSTRIFSFSADGAIAYQPGQEGVLFPLPLDPAKADPAAVAALTEEDAPPASSSPEEVPADVPEVDIRARM